MFGGLNVFAYAEGDPISYSDPFGSCPESMGGEGKTTSLMDCPEGSKGWERVSGGAKEAFGPQDLLAFSGIAVSGARALIATAARRAVASSVVEGGVLRTSKTVAGQLAGERAYIPSHAILETIRGGARVSDVQGAAGRFMYTSGVQFTRGGKASRGTLDVLVNEHAGIIEHVLYRSVR